MVFLCEIWSIEGDNFLETFDSCVNNPCLSRGIIVITVWFLNKRSFFMVFNFNILKQKLQVKQILRVF
jgi:hypothetical protein